MSAKWCFLLVLWFIEYAFSEVSQNVKIEGRWIRDGNLGVYTVTIDQPGVYRVKNEIWRQENWKFARLNYSPATGNVTLLTDANQVVTGQLWPSTGTHVLWNNSVSWHYYASDVSCNRQTKRSVETMIDNTINETAIQPRFDVTRVHVIFMTHFDLGYTDFAWCTVSQYFWQIFPGVVQTALADPTFIYTTQPWLLYMHMNCDRLKQYIINVPEVDFYCPTPDMVKSLEDMIRRRQLVWHAFAYDGFNELLGQPMFSIGFNFAQWLSDKYGVPPAITMSNVDIPGLYRAELPTMISKGVKALYIGQNYWPGWAGAVPNLPNLFRWQSPVSNDYIVTFTHKLGYGGLTPFDAVIDPVSGEALAVQCTLENTPPYTPVDVKIYINRVKRYFPNAQVAPSTFDAFAQKVLISAPGIEIVNKDIGDPWVRAVPTDPVKTATFLAQRRDLEACITRGQCLPTSTPTLDEVLFLMTAAEHNWGLFWQSNSWEQAIFSYQEKRDFLKSAQMIRNNSTNNSFPITNTLEAINVSKVRTIPTAPCAIVEFDAEAAVKRLEWNGINYANATHRLGLALYTEHQLQNYNGTNQYTADGDPMAKYVIFTAKPVLLSTYTDNCLLFTAISQLNQNDTDYGPLVLNHTLQFFPNNNSATYTLQIRNKALSYNMYSSWKLQIPIGNAISIQFRPASSATTPPPWTVTALGVEYSPSNFATAGVSHYHIVDSAKFSNILSIRPLDTPLLLFGNNSASYYTDWLSPPDYDAGAWFNIFNQWNANWIVGWPWNPENVTARYEISFL